MKQTNIWDIQGIKNLYNTYRLECLDTDGDWSMTFIEWFNKNYPQ